MLITMFTDVSVIPPLGAYAIWAKVDGVAHKQSAVFRTPMADSNIAEICAVVNGFSFVLRRIQPPAGSRIIAETDSLTAIEAFEGRNRNAIFAPYIEHGRRLISGTGIVVTYRHVKGHSGGKSPRDAVNRWCDRTCRAALRNHQAAM